ncbi:MAG: carbon monoxide dehydrogenase subunit G [Chloroflexi bacterium]|nr:carbon monoxide dehydrogenase subunit G [Chloroflexota bacterium]
MPLKLNGSLTVTAARDQVWNLLFDVESMKQLASKIPGVKIERLVQLSDDKYEGTATVGFAMVKGKYDGTLTLTEKRAPEFVKVHAEGKSGANWTSGDVALTLAQEADKTTLTYEGVGNVGGTLASLGQRLIDTVGKQVVAQGSKALAEELEARSQAKS